MNDAVNWAIMTGLAQNENVNGRGLIQTLYSNLNTKCAVFAGTSCRDILPDIYIGPRHCILVLLLIRVKPVEFSLACICFGGEAPCDLVFRVCKSSTDLSTLGATTVRSEFQYVAVFRNIRWIVWLDAAFDAFAQQATRADSNGREKGPPFLAFTTFGFGA